MPTSAELTDEERAARVAEKLCGDDDDITRYLKLQLELNLAQMRAQFKAMRYQADVVEALAAKARDAWSRK